MDTCQGIRQKQKKKQRISSERIKNIAVKPYFFDAIY